MDHNLDLLKYEQHSNTNELLNINLDMQPIPTMNKPTRITTKTATLIDNIIINNRLESHYTSNIILTDISDHVPCLLTLKGITKTTRTPLTITSRKLDSKVIEKIRGEINEINWIDTLHKEDVDKAFEYFYWTLQNVLDKVAPEKTYTVPPNKILRETWLTPGLMRCIKTETLI